MMCGTSLSGDGPARRESRKTVTVVFSDVTGSTALGERLDPESVRRVMSRYFDMSRRILELHGGTVEKFIGDAVMAVFGIPTVHEDDALRAVRATAELRGGLETLNDDLETEWGVRIDARTGVNTGSVIAGDPSQGQAFVSGDAVNVAARLEQAAKPGEVLIGAATHRLVRDAVEAEPVESLALKGKAEAVSAWRLIDVGQRQLPLARLLDTPFIGRQHELHLLGEASLRSQRERTCHLFTILGTAGVGKSRLIGEFLSSVQNDALILKGRCLPYGEGISFWPLTEVVLQACNVGEGDSFQELHKRLLTLLEGEEQQGYIADRVLGLIGISEASAAAEEGFLAVRKLFETLARRKSLILLLEDLHWAEPTFLDLVEHIADWSRNAPILLLCVARPEMLDNRPDWGGGKFNASSMLLEPFSDEESNLMVQGLLGDARLPTEARSRIAEAAEGNPLFVEHMIGMLIDDGLLHRHGGSWTLVANLERISVPPTVEALLAARLDRLNDEERQVIERASVAGRVFYSKAVTELSPEHLRPRVASDLLKLVRRELIRPQEEGFYGSEAFQFRHILIRDAAYQSMPKELRAELHERFAGWLKGIVGDRLTEYDEILGYHLEQAYLYLHALGPVGLKGEALGGQAADRLATAGRRAFDRGDMAAAVNLLDRAATLRPDVHPDKGDLLIDLGDALWESGDLVRADAALAEAQEIARATDQTTTAIRARLGRIMLQQNTDPNITMEQISGQIRQIIPLLEQSNAHLGLAKAWGFLGMIEIWLGGLAVGEELLERAIFHAQRAHDRRAEADHLGFLALAAPWGSRTAKESIARVEEIRRRGRRNPVVEAFALISLADCEGLMGDFERARRHIIEGRESLNQLGLKTSWAASSMIHGQLELRNDRPLEAERILRPAYEVLEAMSETGYLSEVAATLARSLYVQGRHDEADRFAETSSQATTDDDLQAQAAWRTVRGKLLAGQGRFVEAEAMMRQAIRMVEATEWLSDQADCSMGLAEILMMGGRPSESLPLLEAAIELYERKGDIPSAARAHAMRAQVVA